MSELTVPSIDFDTETSLTEGPEHDDFAGTAGNDWYISAVNGFTTLNPADNIRGGSGGEDMLSITFTGNSGPQAVGFYTSDIDVFQIRNFVTGGPDAYVNMIDVTGTSTLWFASNTGDTDFEFVQNLMGLVATGGDFNADIEYSAAATAGLNDEQEILIQGTMADFDITGAIENVWLHANGAPSMLDINSAATTFKVMGSAPSVYIDQGGADLAVFDATGFAGSVEADLAVGNGGGTATVDTSTASDELDLWSNSSSTVQVATRNGNDDIEIDNAWRAEVLSGWGDDTVEAGTHGSQIGGGGVDIRTALGDDHVEVNTSGNADVYTGKGADTVELQNVGGNAFLSTGNLDDVITNVGGVQGFLTAQLGWGNDSLTTYAGGGAHITAAKGDDVINITDSNGDVTILGGGGNNTMSATITGAWYDDGTFDGGSMVDVVNFYGYGHLNATLRDGNDVVNANRVDEQMWLSLGEGDDTLDLSSNSSYGYLYGSDTVMGEGGTDTIRAQYLWNINSGGAFANTSSVERAQLEYNTSSGFNGLSTGANAAGVMTYDFLSNLNTSTYLYELANDVTLNMQGNGGLYYFGSLDLDNSGGPTTANLNFANGTSGTGSTGWYTMYVYDVGTLNVNVTDTYSDIYTNTTVLGSGSSFIADSDLTTVNLEGSTHIHMADVSASGLSLIDGSTMSTNIFLDTDNVADAGIAIKTGSGNDTVKRDDTSSDYDIETNGGNDTVQGSGGDDNVKLGSGDDLVKYTNASDLNTFDTVDGGIGTDTLQIDNGSLNNDDKSFFLISDIENWILSTSADTLTLGNIAQASGLQSIDLGTNRGAVSGNDNISLEASYSNPLSVFLGWGPGSDDTVDAGLSGATLTVKARSYDLDDGADIITGGTGNMDELQIFDVNNYNVQLDNMTGVEKATVTVWDTSDIGFYLDGDDNVAAGKTLAISTRTDWSSQGDLDVYGSGETDGMLVVTGGWGNDYIDAGQMADNVTTNQGNDTVYGNGGNDTIDAGDGNNDVYGGDGNDSITAGTGNDEIYGGNGVDNISAGSGADTVDGGAGGDNINMGGNDGGADILVYNAQTDSFGGNVDQVSGLFFGDKIDVSNGALSDIGGQYFKGNAATFGEASGLAKENDGIIDVIFQVDDEVLWVDVNDDGTLNQNDLQIHLIGVSLGGGLDDNGDGTSDNLILDVPAP
jgi:RTX calcium-binding nonapeptide repeat (4 copies)